MSKIKIELEKIAFKVKRIAEKSILQGHPWVYESSITKQNKEGETGDLAVIFDQRRNQLLAIGLYDADSVIRIRILHVGGPANLDSDFFSQKMGAAYRKRSSLLETETTAYRLIYGENDGLPGLIIDIYNENAVIKLYSGVWFNFLDFIVSILQDEYSVKTIVLRLNRLLQHAENPYNDGQVIWGSLENEEVLFYEHGLKFKANLLKGHKTGYFLDHRHNRLKVRGLARGGDVLDVFSYAGGFSVNALAGSAIRVISLDISAQALAIAKSNVALNFKDARHEVMATDAFEGIRKLRKDSREFDLIIVDPPSFAKSAEQIPGAEKSYRRLLREVLPLVKSGGILLMCSCSSRIEKDDFYELVVDELRSSGRGHSILEKTDHDTDHPLGIRELNYLKSIYLRID